MLNSEQHHISDKEKEMPARRKKTSGRKRASRKKKPKKRSSKGGFWNEVEKFLGITKTRKRRKQ